MKKKIMEAFMLFSMAVMFGLTGCSGNADISGQSAEIEDDDEDGEKPDYVNEPAEITCTEIDYHSDKSVMSFLKGDWDLVDVNSGTVYGELKITKKGECSYTYLPTRATCQGTIEVYEEYDAALSGIHSYKISFDGLQDSFGCYLDSDSSSGRFRITQAEGRDYLYLEEIGNGGSFISYDVFSSPEVSEFDLDMKWVFVRDNDVTKVGENVYNSHFYAALVEIGDDGLLLQQQDLVTREAYNEYTSFKFLSAVFDESSHPDAVWYEVSADADMSGILHEQNLSKAFPSLVYEVTTDSKGRIDSLKEVERAFYGEYELYALEQDVSYEGTTFSVNDHTLDLDYYGIAGNAIVNCEVFGEDLIIEAHVNPHMSTYTIYDMRAGWPEKTITGCNFVYDKKVWDSFYSYMDKVYDYEGREVYTVDGAEVCNLSIDGNELHIEYWKDDYDEVYEVTIDRPKCLNAPNYAFADFRHHENYQTWNEFMSYAPDGAAAMIMINPHEDDTWDFYMPYQLDGTGGDDIMYVVSLYDGTMIDVDRADPETVERGEIRSYSLTVPEGAPSHTVFVSRPNECEYEWPVSIISGKDDIRWTFIPD